LHVLDGGAGAALEPGPVEVFGDVSERQRRGEVAIGFF
jgi:hypothetical protein